MVLRGLEKGTDFFVVPLNKSVPFFGPLFRFFAFSLFRFFAFSLFRSFSLLMLSQLTSLLAAAAVNGDLDTGSKIAEKATTFNYLFHAELVEREQKLNTCTSPADCQSIRDFYNNLDTARNREFGQYCQQNPAGCGQITKQLADEIPANEKLLHDGRSSGVDRSATLWEITRSNERAINTGIIEHTRTEKGDGAALLAELASNGLSPDRGLFASTAGGKGGTTGVKVGVVGDGAKGSGIKNVYESIKKAPQYPVGFREKGGGTTKNVVNNMEVLEDLRKVEPGKWTKVYKDGFSF